MGNKHDNGTASDYTGDAVYTGGKAPSDTMTNGEPDWIPDSAPGYWRKNPKVYGPDGKKLPDFGKAVFTFLTNKGDEPFGSHPALGVRQGSEKSNFATWTEPDPEEVVGSLFKGSSGDFKGESSKRCERQGGTVPGIGPKCMSSTFKEDAQFSVMKCAYDAVMECITEFKASVEDATELLTSQDLSNKKKAYQIFGYAGLEVEKDPNSINRYKKLSEPRRDYVWAEVDYKKCVEKLEDKCECKKCTVPWYTGRGDGENDSEEATPPDTTQDQYSDKWNTISTASQVGIPIPRIWGRWVVGGNIIDIGNTASVMVDQTVESSGGKEPPYEPGSPEAEALAIANAISGKPGVLTAVPGVAAKPVEITVEVSGVRTTTTTEYDLFASFSVGLCHGEMDSLLRIFSDDVLLFTSVMDDTNPGDTVGALNLSAFADSDTKLGSLTARTPYFRLYRGTASQKVNPLAVVQHGFGRVPAYRDLSYLDIQNLNITLVKGNFPNLRVDVCSKIKGNTIPHIESAETSNLIKTFLHVDPLQGLVYTRSANKYFIWDSETLQLKYTGDIPNNCVITVSNIGYIQVWTSQYDMYVINPFDDGTMTVEYNSTIDFAKTEANGNLSQPFRAFDTAFKGSFCDKTDELNGGSLSDSIIVTDAQNNIWLLANLYSFEVGYVEGPMMDSAPFSPSERKVRGSGIALHDNRLNYYQFYLGTASQPTLSVVECPIRTSSYSTVVSYQQFWADINYGTDPRYLLPGDVKTTEFSAQDMWGGATTGVHLQQVIYDASSGGFILFFSTASEYWITKLNIAASSVVDGVASSGLTVAWSVRTSYPLANWNTSSTASTKSASTSLTYISSNGYLVSVDLRNGDVEVIGALTDYELPAYAAGNAQFYDGRTDSIWYISAESGHQPQINRIYLKRVITERVSLATIIQDVAAKYPTTTGILDTTDIEGITVAGFAITEATSVKLVIELLSDFYQIAAIDDGSKIFLTGKGALNVSTDIHDDDIIAGSRQLSTVSDGTFPDTVSVSFSSLTTTGMAENIQEVSVRASDEEILRAPNVLSFTVPVQDDPSIIRRYAEQALQAARSEETKMSLELLPKMIALTPQDPVVYEGITYRLGRTAIGSKNTNEVDGSFFSVDEFMTQTALNQVLLDSGRVTTGQTAHVPPYRPVVLFTNALTNEDVLESTGGNQVVYTLIEGPDAEFEPIQFHFYTMPQTAYLMSHFGDPLTRSIDFSPVYKTKPISKGAHYGRLLEKPNSFNHNVYGQALNPLSPGAMNNRDDYMVIRFSRADSLEHLQNVDDPFNTLSDTPTKNLIIVGRECIQYGSFEITDEDTNEVTFTNLIRGQFGTEPYLEHEIVGGYNVADRCYLYTEDTFQTMVIDAYYTKRRIVGISTLSILNPIGTSPIEWAQITDGGSARPYAPTHLKFWAADEDEQSVLGVSFKRRASFTFDTFKNLDTVTDLWNSKSYIITTAPYYVDALTFEERASGGLLDVPYFVQHDAVPDGKLVDDFLVMNSMLTDQKARRYITIAQIAYDAHGEPIVGHPSYSYWAANAQPGTYPVYPF